MDFEENLEKSYKKFLEDNFDCSWAYGCNGFDEENPPVCELDPFDTACPLIEGEIKSIKRINLPGMNLVQITPEQSIRPYIARVDEEGNIIGARHLDKFEDIEEGDYELAKLISIEKLMKWTPLAKAIVSFMRRDDKEFLEHFADYMVENIDLCHYLSLISELISEYNKDEDFMDYFVEEYLLKSAEKKGEKFLSDLVDTVVEEGFYSKELVRYMDEKGLLEKYIKFNRGFAYEFALDAENYRDIIDRMSGDFKEYIDFLRNYKAVNIEEIYNVYKSGVKLPKYALNLFVDGSFSSEIYEKYKDVVMEVYREAEKLGYRISADPIVQNDYIRQKLD